MKRRVEEASAWFYRGLWRKLVDWFAVPDRPPDLPLEPGEELEAFRPARGYLDYLRFWFWLGLLPIDGLLLVLWLASFAIAIWVGILLFPLFLVLAVLPDVFIYIGLHLRYDSTWYVLSPRSLRIRRGIWVIRETTITFENVQDVKVQQGPIQRAFGIADVLVETAGGGAEVEQKGAVLNAHRGLIEGIADAARVRDRILARVGRSRSAGLGDERERWEPRACSAAQIELLAEIHRELAAVRPGVAGH